MPSDSPPLRFLADIGVAGRVVEHLRVQGHDAVHLREEGLQRLPDKEIFAKAILEKRIVLTFDLDFGEIAAFAGRDVASVVIFRLPNARAPYVIERLNSVLTTLRPELAFGAVVTVEATRLRVRRLPIARKAED